MARYIDVDKKIEEMNRGIESITKLIENRPYDEEAKLILREHGFCLYELERTPIANVVEIKHGEWLHKEYHLLDDKYICSVCGFTVPERYRHCPKCISRMDGGVE